MLNRFIKQKWLKKWNENEKERTLYRVISTFIKQVLKTYKSLRKWINSILSQMRTQKIELQKFLFTKKVSNIDNFECNRKAIKQDVLHILWHYVLLRKKRKIMWKDEMKKSSWWFELTHLRTLLNKFLFARKATIFMTNIDLLEQFKNLTTSQKI